MAKNSSLTANQQQAIKEGIEKINSLYADFEKEIIRLKKERQQVINRIIKKADEEKIQNILKSLK